MPLTPEDRAALAAMAERADPTDRDTLARLAAPGDPDPAPDPATEQTARVRELLAGIRERTSIR